MHWRYSANRTKLGPLDASALIPLVLILIWPFKTNWTFSVILYGSLIMVVVLFVMSRRGYAPRAAIRLFRSKIGQWLGRGQRPIRLAYQQYQIRKTR